MKAFTTFVFFILCIATYAQKMEFKTSKDRRTNETSTIVYSIDLDAKTIKIKFDDGKKEEYKIIDIDILKNEEDEDLFPNGITYTEYSFECAEKSKDIYEMQQELQYLTIIIPNSERFYGVLRAKNHYRNTGDSYDVERTK
ncbi:MAG: hypothetical protein ACI35Z_06040 [Sphingobacterium hotanense]